MFQTWYFRRPPWDTGISPPELLEFIQQHPPGTAIDIGCGTGTNVITLAKAGWQVTGVDFVPRAVKLARRKIQQAGISASVFVSDATELSGISSLFDLVLDIGCFHAISKEGQSKYLDQLNRILAPNGFWLLYGFLRPVTALSTPGLVETDLDSISARYSLLSRRNGFDRDRRSVWFLFQKRAPAQAAISNSQPSFQ